MTVEMNPYHFNVYFLLSRCIGEMSVIEDDRRTRRKTRPDATLSIQCILQQEEEVNGVPEGASFPPLAPEKSNR
jgi:hypothetical protein